MPLQTLDQIIAARSNGQYADYAWNKITGGSAYTAGRWYDFSPLNGTPVANAWAGTALAWTSCNEAAGNGTQIFGIPHGGNVSALVKNLGYIAANTAIATGVPGQLKLLDLQGYWPGISCNTTSAQTLTGTPTLRYSNGAGLRLFPVITSVSGATAQNFNCSYTDQAGNAGNVMPVTVAMTASAIVGHIPTSGTAANNYGPYLPLANGDTGVQNVATVTMSAANTGTFALCLAKELANIPITTAGVMAERNLFTQIMGAPIVKDGACLTWIYMPNAATAASTNFQGVVDCTWG